MAEEKIPEIPYRTRLANKLAEPELLDHICGHVASGSSVISLAKTWDLRYADVMRWIRSDKAREKIYEKAIQDRGEWAMESILNELSAIAHVDIREAFDENGELKPIHEIPEHIARAISAIDVDELWEGSGENREQVGVTRKVKFWNKLEALVKRGMELGMFRQKVDLTADSKLEDLLALSRKPAEPKPAPAPEPPKEEPL